MNLQKPLYSLMFVFDLLFCLAFACNDDDDARQTDTGGGNTASDGATSSGLPTETYACFTTIEIYAGQGGDGSYSYPIYNYSRQTRGEINVKSNGTYSVGGKRCHYS